MNGVEFNETLRQNLVVLNALGLNSCAVYNLKMLGEIQKSIVFEIFLLILQQSALFLESGDFFSGFFWRSYLVPTHLVQLNFVSTFRYLLLPFTLNL